MTSEPLLEMGATLVARSVDTTVPYPDVQDCSVIYVVSDIRYDLVVGSCLDDCWVVENLGPSPVSHT